MSEVEVIFVVLLLLVDTCGKQCESFLASSAEHDELTGVIDPEQGTPMIDATLNTSPLLLEVDPRSMPLGFSA